MLPRVSGADHVASEQVRSFIDAPCGDFAWMRTMIPEFEQRGVFYVGGDIAEAMIQRLQNEFWSIRNVRFVEGGFNEQSMKNLHFQQICSF